ncbi:hypothetical protein MED297_07048 [Reinekea sp. MED297]|uniref:Uncharacterized protein n=1 Tax=Reinekea blandensis MED297 TaxID=314283 RepID=A4BFA6_9GAMM|nr:hypothetical protein MED297_07048 [Reinekea sp. MED297] [Reinekea blandensis MED297]
MVQFLAETVDDDLARQTKLEELSGTHKGVTGHRATRAQQHSAQCKSALKGVVT